MNMRFFMETQAILNRPQSDMTDAKPDRYPLEDDSGRYAWMNFIRAGSNDKRSDRPKLYYPIVVTEKDQIRVPKMLGMI